MTARTTTNELKGELDGALPKFSDEDRHLAQGLLRLLAEGEPIELDRLAEVLGDSTRDAGNAIEELLPFVHQDKEERIVGFGGLSVTETPHRLRIDGRSVYAWCAWDTLFLPIALGEEARVQSTCPATGQPIALTVAPEGVSDVAPQGAVMSFLLPGEEGLSGDVIRSFCHYVHFFASNQAARAWTAEHEDTFQLSIEDGFELGRFWAVRNFAADPDPTTDER